MGLENLHRQNRELGNTKKWLVFKRGMNVRKGGGGSVVGEISVQPKVKL